MSWGLLACLTAGLGAQVGWTSVPPAGPAPGAGSVGVLRSLNP